MDRYDKKREKKSKKAKRLLEVIVKQESLLFHFNVGKKYIKYNFPCQRPTWRSSKYNSALFASKKSCLITSITKIRWTYLIKYVRPTELVSNSIRTMFVPLSVHLPIFRHQLSLPGPHMKRCTWKIPEEEKRVTTFRIISQHLPRGTTTHSRYKIHQSIVDKRPPQLNDNLQKACLSIAWNLWYLAAHITLGLTKIHSIALGNKQGLEIRNVEVCGWRND
jgi:hypothetical protein